MGPPAKESGASSSSAGVASAAAAIGASSASPFSSAAPLVAGLSGGAVSTALLYPLDLVKVRLQVNEDPLRRPSVSASSTGGAGAGTSGGGTASAAAPPRPRRTILRTMGGVIKYEGFLGLYQGLTPALVGSAASWGGYFFLYEGIKRRWVERRREEMDDRRRRRPTLARAGAGVQRRQSKHPHDYSKDMHVDEEIDIDTNSDDDCPDGAEYDCSLGPMENFSAACAAGAVMVLLTNPVWLIKTRMQLQMKRAVEHQKTTHCPIKGVKSVAEVKAPYKSMTDAARTIVREEGPLALYKGAVPALMLVSHGGVQFVTYEFLKKRFGTYTRAARSKQDERNDERSKTTAEKLQDSLGYLAMGAVSKMIASTSTYPLQVIKARLQQRSQSVELTEGGELAVVRREYQGVADCVGRIWRNEGAVGFFKGCIPNAIRVAPSAAITFVTYETIMDMLS